MEDKRINKISLRVSAASSVFGFLIGLFQTEGDIVESLMFGVVIALVAGFVSLVGGMMIRSALDYSREFRNPVAQGLAFAFMIVALLGIVDLLFMRGIYMVSPAISLVFNQSLDGTYWKCENWAVVEEGSYCADE